jgi:hypothetical protein
MEGTRHEKIALIVISYVIGFTSAFIAFGVNKIDSGERFIPIEDVQAMNSDVSDTHHSELSVGVGEEGLFVITKDKERILSANKNLLEASVISSEPISGFFYNIIEAEASRDGNFVYFCEQLMEEDAHCDPYVYSVLDDTLYRVTFEDEKIQPLILAHDSTWTDESTLILNSAVSVDPGQPWKLGTAVAVSQ